MNKELYLQIIYHINLLKLSLHALLSIALYSSTHRNIPLSQEQEVSQWIMIMNLVGCEMRFSFCCFLIPIANRLVVRQVTSLATLTTILDTSATCALKKLIFALLAIHTHILSSLFSPSSSFLRQLHVFWVQEQGHKILKFSLDFCVLQHSCSINILWNIATACAMMAPMAV